MPKGACSSRVSRAVNGAMVEVSGKKSHSGLGGFAWEQGPDFSILMVAGGRGTAICFVARRSFWMPKGACSSRVRRAVNGAMVEVSGKKSHSGLGGFSWEQGPDVYSFEP